MVLLSGKRGTKIDQTKKVCYYIYVKAKNKMSELPKDNHPVNIDRFVRFTELAGLQIEDPAARIKALQSTDADEFLDVLSVSNGLLLGEDSFQRWGGEPASVNVSSPVFGVEIDPPDDSHEIFKIYYEKFQSELQPNEQDMQKAAVEMHFAIVGSHMFADGNGRLARAAYYLLKDGRLPDDQALVLERRPGIAQASDAVNRGAVAVLLDREGINYEYVNDYAADDKQTDEDGIFADGGLTQQLKYIAARRVMIEQGNWPEQPPETIGIRNWPTDKMQQFKDEYKHLREEWLAAFIDTAGAYAPGLSRLIDSNE